MKDIKFPFTSCFTSKRGYTWHYMVYESGMIAYMEREYTTPITKRASDDRRVKIVCGGYRLASKLAKPTKECLKDIYEKVGRYTDGWQWVDSLEPSEDINDYPLDGSYRQMRRTTLISRDYNRTHRIYEHVPTGGLYFWDDDRWVLTYKSYCHNEKTGEDGEYFRWWR